MRLTRAADHCHQKAHADRLNSQISRSANHVFVLTADIILGFTARKPPPGYYASLHVIVSTNITQTANDAYSLLCGRQTRCQRNRGRRLAAVIANEVSAGCI